MEEEECKGQAKTLCRKRRQSAACSDFYSSASQLAGALVRWQTSKHMRGGQNSEWFKRKAKAQGAVEVEKR